MEKEPFVYFDGKIVVVSGASSGMGRAISIELSRRGARVVVLGRNRERLEETQSLLEGSGHHLLSLDLEEHSEIVPKIRDLAERIGHLYGLCHSAGIVETRPLAASTAEGVKRMLNVNFISGIELVRGMSRKDVMGENGGSILFISSVYGHVGVPAQVAYCGTKGGMAAAARAMAVELARRKIRVNVLSPGMVHTSMTEKAMSILTEEQSKRIVDAHPLGIGSPEDVAKAAVFLLAPQNPWITGADLIIDGGFSAK